MPSALVKRVAVAMYEYCLPTYIKYGIPGMKIQTFDELYRVNKVCWQTIAELFINDKARRKILKAMPTAHNTRSLTARNQGSAKTNKQQPHVVRFAK